MTDSSKLSLKKINKLHCNGDIDGTGGDCCHRCLKKFALCVWYVAKNSIESSCNS